MTEEITKAQQLAWRVREDDRFIIGEYKHVIWHKEHWYLCSDHHTNHYVHVSTKDPALIAFTASEAHGVADRQTAMKPGRYLAKYYSDVLSPQQIADWVAKYSAAVKPVEVHFATTEAEIEWVYTNGPSSCMSYYVDDFASSVHPTRVYAAGDLAIAYLLDPEDEDHVTARVVAWPAKNVFGRIYGDSIRLREALEGLGYTEGSLVGAKLLRIEDRGRFVCPYIDTYGCVSDCGDYLTIEYSGIDAQNTNGLSSVEYVSACAECDESLHEDEEYTTRDDVTLCESCYADCGRCDECSLRYYDTDHLTTVVSASSANRLVELCDDCNSDVWFCDECEQDTLADHESIELVDGEHLDVCAHCVDGVMERLTECEYTEQLYSGEQCPCDQHKQDYEHEKKQLALVGVA